MTGGPIECATFLINALCIGLFYFLISSKLDEKMTRKCIIAGCKSGYASNAKRVSLFRVPKNNKLRAKWVKAIATTLNLTTAHSVCEKHFLPSEIL